MGKLVATKRKKDHGSLVKSIVSAELETGEHVELIYDRDAHTTALVMRKGKAWRIVKSIEDRHHTLVPLSADNNMLQHGVVLFPSAPEDYGSQATLIDDLAAYIHRYVDLEEGCERLIAYYILFTWVFDHFNELPYLRIKGDFGTGKTRFLQIVGSVCYRPIFANGASTISPIFHMLDTFGGTLIVDEADFRFSDETAEIAKIFNNGNVRGMPVLRAQATRDRDFNPRVFQVFGPKVIAMRGDYADAALESRFLTLLSKRKRLRDDVPINLPATYSAEALALRNKLLAYRLTTYGQFAPLQRLSGSKFSYRESQILIPLFSIIEDESERKHLCQFVTKMVQARLGDQ
ncbi:MAG: hypothetical protein CML99_07185 [Rhodobiaceae bacterium]|nr:hypothetical protein [Rhodobiaceae bacterium]